jgi:hypothetical protein
MNVADAAISNIIGHPYGTNITREVYKVPRNNGVKQKNWNVT